MGHVANHMTRRSEISGQLEDLHFRLAQVKAAIESLEQLQGTRRRRMHIEGYQEAA